MPDHHNAIPLDARGLGHWVECDCGWISRSYYRQADALTAHARHVARAKEAPDD